MGRKAAKVTMVRKGRKLATVSPKTAEKAARESERRDRKKQEK